LRHNPSCDPEFRTGFPLSLYQNLTSAAEQDYMTVHEAAAHKAKAQAKAAVPFACASGLCAA
jgi:hypothetical protein